MGLHLRSEVFAKLVRHPRLVGPAMQLRGGDLYVQQVKVNVKAAFSGQVWQWHYDFATHHGEDGVPEPLALNLHVFLDDIDQFNGPLYFIPGSHTYGAAPATLDTASTSYPLWVVERDWVTELAAKHGIAAATGKAGTGPHLRRHPDPRLAQQHVAPGPGHLFPDPESGRQRSHPRGDRPDHKHHRDLTPVRPLADDCLGA